MNIQEAKDAVKDAVRAYLDKDGTGGYVIPRSRQRPIMIMGAPGLGKTAIMSQIAAELGIGYVGYTITHHTRQSAIGLPMIETRCFGGEESPITRYTMSEIIASVYEAMEAQGRREGILFIDEVNCVSETLSAAMLDLLQNKKFGPHRIPPGWVLVAAGNPPEFNSSAREFDIATLDRIRVIEVEPDTDVWLRYAVSAGVHDSVTYYLNVKPQNLLSIRSTPDGPVFVTPRGWEDLSTVLKEYDSLGLETDIGLVSQYIRDPDIASEFVRYLGFHRRYKEEYDVTSILDGSSDPERIRGAGAEEKLSVMSVIVGRLNSEAEEGLRLETLASVLRRISDGGSREDAVRELRSRAESSSDPAGASSFCLSVVSGDADPVRTLSETEDGLRTVSSVFETHLSNAVGFMMDAFGRGQETVSLMAGLISCYSVVMFSKPGGVLYGLNDSVLRGEGASRWRTG